MAKTKKGKKEELVDLTPKPEKISAEHLNKAQGVINNLNKIQLDIGIMESRKHAALHDIAGLNDELTLLRTEFQKEYGTYDINIQNGTINYPPENGETDKKD